MAEDSIKSFKDLNTWKEAHKLCLRVYLITKKLPDEERFGLSSQMRRAAISIPSNIAEGFSRRSYADKSQFYGIALGSNTELQSQILIAKDLDYITESDYNDLMSYCINTNKLLNGLIKQSRLIHNL